MHKTIKGVACIQFIFYCIAGDEIPNYMLLQHSIIFGELCNFQICHMFLWNRSLHCWSLNSRPEEVGIFAFYSSLLVLAPFPLQITHSGMVLRERARKPIYFLPRVVICMIMDFYLIFLILRVRFQRNHSKSVLLLKKGVLWHFAKIWSKLDFKKLPRSITVASNSCLY